MFEGLLSLTVGQGIMFLIGSVLIWLAIAKEYEPTLLLPIGHFRHLRLYKKAETAPAPDPGIDRTELDKPPNEHPPYIWQLRVPGVDRIAL